MSKTISVDDAVNFRRSVRAFLARPVARQTIVEILEIARRSPSGGNLQPWRIDVIGENAVESLRSLMADRLASGETEHPEYPIYPESLWEPHRTYRYQVSENMYERLGVKREDKTGRRRQFEENFKLFGAPAAIFFSLDRRFGAAQWADIGMLMQTIMLLAVGRGLGTCPQECWSLWPRTMRDFLDLQPDELLFAGMAIGYPDDRAAVNQLVTERAPTEAFTRFHGY